MESDSFLFSFCDEAVADIVNAKIIIVMICIVSLSCTRFLNEKTVIRKTSQIVIIIENMTIRCEV